MAYNDIRTPEQHAAVLGEAYLEDGAIVYSAGHNAAAQLHGWEAHKLATTELFTLREGYYQEAISVALSGANPYASALSPYAISGEVPPIGPGKHVVVHSAGQEWVTFEDLELPTSSTQVFDYTIKAYGYLQSTPTTRVTEVAHVRVTRDGSGNASLLSSATPFSDARLRVNVATDDITIDVRAHATEDWVWDTEAIRQVNAGITAHLPDGTTQAVSEITDGAGLVDGRVVINQGFRWYGPPRGGTLDDGAGIVAAAHQAALENKYLRLLPGDYYWSSRQPQANETWTIRGPGAGSSIHFVNPTGNDPTNACIYKTTFAGTTTTTLTALSSKGSQSITVDTLPTGLVGGALINVRPADGSFAGEVFEVIGAPTASGGDYVVRLSQAIRAASYAIGAIVEVVTDQMPTLDWDGEGTEVSGTGHRFLTLSRNLRSHVRNFAFSSRYGVSNQLVSFDNLARQCIISDCIGEYSDSDAFAFPPFACEGGEDTVCERVKLYNIDNPPFFYGLRCVLRDCVFTLRPTASGPVTGGEQGLDSVDCGFERVTVIGGTVAFGFGADLQGGSCICVRPFVRSCRGIGNSAGFVSATSTLGVGIHNLVVGGPPGAECIVEPPPSPSASWYILTTGSSGGISTQPQVDGLTCSAPSLVEVQAFSGVVLSNLRRVRLTNVLEMIRYTGAGNQTARMQDCEYSCSIATNKFAMYLARACRVICENLRLNGAAAGGNVAYNDHGSEVAKIEFIDSDVTASNLTTGNAFCVRNRNSRLTGAVGANTKMNIQSVVLNGTEQAVAFADARAGDPVTVTTTTAGGTPGPRTTRLLAGTGAYVTGAAGDTSTVQVVIG